MVEKEVLEMRSGWSHWCWDNIKHLLVVIENVLFQVGFKVKVSFQIQFAVKNIRKDSYVFHILTTACPNQVTKF